MTRAEHSVDISATVVELRTALAALQAAATNTTDQRSQVLTSALDLVEKAVAAASAIDAAWKSERAEFIERLRRADTAIEAARLTKQATAAANEEFLATVSHELRTPVTAILGWIRVLRASGSSPDQATTARALTSIERSARLEARLIEDLLDVAQLTLGRLRLDAAAVDLGTIVVGTIDIVAATATAKAIEVSYKSPPAVFVVWGDAVRLQQVFWNLLTNALKFTPRGGRVDVELTPLDTDVAVSIRDTGIGIDPAVLPYVFEQFRRGEETPTRRHGGLGLGLAIVRQLVEGHGGTVVVESDGANRGTVVTVTLPLRDQFEERRATPRLPFDAISAPSVP